MFVQTKVCFKFARSKAELASVSRDWPMV